MAYLRKKDRSPFWTAVFRDRYGKQHFRSTKVPHSASTVKERTELEKRALQVAEGYERIARGELQRETDVKRIALELAAIAGGHKVETKSLRKFLNDWIDAEENQKEPRTIERYKGVANKFITHMGDRADSPVELIRPTDAQDYIKKLSSKGLASKTVSNHLKILRIPFTEAVRLEVLPSNPFAAAKAPAVVSVQREAFTIEELKNILAATGQADNGEEWKTAILLGYFNALRLGDATTMTWDKFNIEESKLVFTPEKKKTEVELPLHPALVSHLSTLKASDDPTAPLCPVLSQVPKSNRPRLSKAFSKLMKTAGVESQQKGAGVRKLSTKTFHSLRHTLSSHLAGKNIAPEVRMKLTDHEDKRVHAGYTHHEFEQLKEALNTLGGLDK